MYEVAVRREFDAGHHLVGGDWGEENHPHNHHYKVEVVLSGQNLDRFGYVTDITILDQAMSEMVSRTAGRSLNDLPEFEGLNPSIEHFSRIWCHCLVQNLETGHLRSITVRIWEDETAWARYTERL